MKKLLLAMGMLLSLWCGSDDAARPQGPLLAMKTCTLRPSGDSAPNEMTVFGTASGTHAGQVNESVLDRTAGLRQTSGALYREHFSLDDTPSDFGIAVSARVVIDHQIFGTWTDQGGTGMEANVFAFALDSSGPTQFVVFVANAAPVATTTYEASGVPSGPGWIKSTADALVLQVQGSNPPGGGSWDIHQIYLEIDYLDVEEAENFYAARRSPVCDSVGLGSPVAESATLETNIVTHALGKKDGTIEDQTP